MGVEPDSASLSVAGVHKRFAGHEVLAGIDLEVDAASTVALLGPSGSGKSTLLRVVAGLEHPDGGRVRIAGEDVTSVPVHRRGVRLEPLLGDSRGPGPRPEQHQGGQPRRGNGPRRQSLVSEMVVRYLGLRPGGRIHGEPRPPAEADEVRNPVPAPVQ